MPVLQIPQVSSASPLTNSSISYVRGDKLALWGKATTSVRASIEDVLSLVWNTNARNQKRADNTEKNCIEEPGNHNRLEYAVMNLSAPFQARELLNRSVWKKVDENSFFYVSSPGS